MRSSLLDFLLIDSIFRQIPKQENTQKIKLAELSKITPMDMSFLSTTETVTEKPKPSKSKKFRQKSSTQPEILNLAQNKMNNYTNLEKLSYEETALVKEITRLRYEYLEIEKVVTNLKSSRDQLVNDHDRLESLLAVEESRKHELENQLVSLAANRDQLRDDNDKLKTTLHGQIRVERDTSESLQVLSKKHAELQNHTQNLQTEISKHEQVLNSLRKDITDAKSEEHRQKAAFEDFRQRSEDEIKEFKREVDDLSIRKSKLESQTESLEKSLSNVTQAYESSNQKLKDSINQLNEVQSSLTNAKNENYSLNIQLNSSRNKLSEYENQIENQAAQLTKLINDNEKLKAETDLARENNLKYMNEMQSSKQENEKIKAQLEENLKYRVYLKTAVVVSIVIFYFDF